MKEERLKKRTLRIWRNDYLIHRHMWKNIERAVSTALRETPQRPPRVLDVGCGNKPYADLFKDCNYQGMDRSAADAEPDIIGDVTSIPVATGTVDIVFCTQVIEHVPDPQALLQECHRILRKGGFLVLTGPFYWPLHEEPHDYHRFTRYGFENLLSRSGFSSWEIRADGGDWTQIFLSINLQLQRTLFIPLIIFFNFLGLILDSVDHGEKTPANYTVLART